MAWLVCTRGSDKGLQVELTKESYTMGRAPDCDVQIVYQRSSRYHCKLIHFRNKLFVEDLDSTNGIKHKGKRVKKKKIKLKEGDTFSIGSDIFEYTASHDKYLEATEDLVSGYGKKSQRSLIEQTYNEAADSSQKRKGKGFGLFSFFKKDKD